MEALMIETQRNHVNDLLKSLGAEFRSIKGNVPTLRDRGPQLIVFQDAVRKFYLHAQELADAAGVNGTAEAVPVADEPELFEKEDN